MTRCVGKIIQSTSQLWHLILLFQHLTDTCLHEEKTTANINCKRLEMRCVWVRTSLLLWYSWGIRLQQKGWGMSDQTRVWNALIVQKMIVATSLLTHFNTDMLNICVSVCTAFCAQIHITLTLHACWCIVYFVYFDFIPKKKNATNIHLPRAEMPC